MRLPVEQLLKHHILCCGLLDWGLAWHLCEQEMHVCQQWVVCWRSAGEKETRAWTIKAGMTAPQAAGVIHTDFEKGFIRAETVAYDDFTTFGGLKAAQEKGKVRLEGKEYVVQEADILNFRFNV